jgi:superfamily II DNA or RNA helicase
MEPLATGAAAAFPYDKKIAKNFWINGAYSEEPIALHRHIRWNSPDGIQEVLLIPRTLAPIGTQDRRSEGVEVEFSSTFKPRDKEQVRIVREAKALLANDESFILEAPTGIGKTWMTMDLIASVGRRTLVVVTKEDIKTQWVAAAKALLGLTNEDIGFIQGDRCDVEGKKIVIAMVQSISKINRYPRSKFAGFGYVIIDECHRMGADKFSQAMWQIPAKIRMGLSATPYRKDGKDIVFWAHIGPIKVRSEALPMIPKVFVLRSSWQLPWVTWGGQHQPLPHQPGRLGKVNKSLAQDPVRNQCIAAWAAKCHSRGRNTIIFSALRDGHLSTLEDRIIQLGVPQKDIGWYVGGLTEQERHVNGRKSIVLATYSMASEATDLPWMDTCILATPRSDVVQIVGRVLRQYPDKKQPVVIDIVDMDSTILLNFGRKRKKWYDAIHAETQRGSLQQKWMTKPS